MENNFVLSAGGSLSWGELTSSGDYPTSWSQLAACTQLPEIGSDPATVETTTLDNLKRRTAIRGLQDVNTLQFPFNLEHPAADANINVVAGLDEDTVYGWKITYPSGITVMFKSRPSYKINPVGINEIESFTLNLIVENEPDITIPGSTSF